MSYRDPAVALVFLAWGAMFACLATDYFQREVWRRDPVPHFVGLLAVSAFAVATVCAIGSVAP